jgi:O-antigen/teichoic acid export membrane protein
MSAPSVAEGPAAGSEPAQPPSHILNLAKQTLVYGASGVLLQVVGVITLPVFARVFSKSEYGLLELSLALSAVTLAIADLGFASAAQRSFFDYRDEDAEERRRVVFTGFASTALLAWLAGLALVVAREPVSRLLFGDGDHGRLIAAVGVSVPLVNMAAFLRETMRLRFRAVQYVVSSVLAAVVAGGLGVFFVVVLDQGVEGIFLGLIVGNALAVGYGGLVVAADLGRRFSSFELRRMLAFGLPLVPAALAMWALTLVDRIMLGKLSNLAEVGQYGVATRLANVLMLVVTGFALAFGPYIFSIFSTDKETEKLVRAKALTYLTIVLAGVGLCLTLFARELIEIVAPSFDRAYLAVGPLVLGVACFGISSILMSGISFVRKTVLFPAVTGVAAALNIGLNFLLIPPFGMVGAAFAASAAFALLVFAYYWLGQRLYPTPYETGKVVLTMALAISLGFLALLPMDPLALVLGAKVLAVAFFAAALRVTGVIAGDEVSRVRELVGGMLRPLRGPA